MLVALLFGSLDGLKVVGLNLEMLNFLPLFELGLAWLFANHSGHRGLPVLAD